tara:strand:- start:1552 stop:1782 length:231 start_codon:yes stop_codon:yes gene_type:complete
MEQIKVGTLIEDMGKIGMIRRIIDAGALEHLHPVVKWRMNYEIYYYDGVVGYLGLDSLQRLVDGGSIKVIFVPEDS